MNHDQVKDSVAQAEEQARKHADTLMDEPTRQGSRTLNETEGYPQHVAESSSMKRRKQSRKPLSAGQVTPWQSGYEHLKLEHHQ